MGELIALKATPGPLDDQAMRQGRALCRQALTRTLKQQAIDLVHFHGLDFYFYLPAPGLPILTTLHLPIVWYPQSALWPSRPSSWFNCVSTSQHGAVADNPHMLKPIGNGVDVERLDVVRRPQGFALVLTRICPEKGIHLAIAAARQAKMPIVIAGEIFPYAAHQDYFARKIAPALGADCRFIGPANFAQKRQLLAEAQCLLVPSLVEETRLAGGAGGGDGHAGDRLRARRLAGDGGAWGHRLSRRDGRGDGGGNHVGISDRSAGVPSRRAPTLQPQGDGPSLFRSLADAGEWQPRAPPGSGLRMALEVGVVSDIAGLEALEPPWWTLFDACPEATPFQSPAWLSRGGGLSPGRSQHHRDSRWRSAGRACTLLYRAGDRRGRLLAVGIGLSDYLDVLVAPDCRDAVLAAIGAAVETLAGWQEWELTDMAPFAAGRALPHLSSCACEETSGSGALRAGARR